MLKDTINKSNYADPLTNADPYTNQGEKEMRQRFPSYIKWDENNLSGMLQEKISSGLAHFIHMQPFFFIATSSNQGHCDVNFRGREYGDDGKALLACRVIDGTKLLFPDYSGNGLYNSLGNIVTNPHIGLLFIDFKHQRRARVNGQAKIMDITSDILNIWPRAQCYVEVKVEQAFGNCSQRIPIMNMVEGSDALFI